MPLTPHSVQPVKSDASTVISFKTSCSNIFAGSPRREGNEALLIATYILKSRAAIDLMSVNAGFISSECLECLFSIVKQYTTSEIKKKA